MKAFLDAGFQVGVADDSKELCALATVYTGIWVLRKQVGSRFQILMRRDDRALGEKEGNSGACGC